MGLTTSRLALPYPVSTDPNNVPSDMLALAARLDLIGASYAQGVASAKPAAGTRGRFFLATDTQTVSMDTGTAWVDLNPASLFTTKGDITVASAADTAARLGVGTDGQALVARSTAVNGVDWETTLGMPIGLLGAVAPTRYVGGTTSGPPTTGTFAVGDFVKSADGWIYTCTTAGTPGTWSSPQPRGVIARAKRVTSPSATAATTSGVAVSILSLTGIPVIAGRLYKVKAPCLQIYAAGGGAGPTIVAAELKYTTDGSTPIVSSPVLKTDDMWVDNAGHPGSLTLEMDYAPASTGTLGVLLDYYIPVYGGASTVNMAASATYPITITVADEGIDPGITGTSY